jgi:hypothetical protein
LFHETVESKVTALGGGHIRQNGGEMAEDRDIFMIIRSYGTDREIKIGGRRDFYGTK